MNQVFDKNINSFNKGFLTGTGIEDPTYLGFKLIFDFDPVHRDHETGQTHDPLFATSGSLESATRYLRAIGYPKRAQMLEEFKEILRYLVKESPWYFQQITGLGELWKIETGENFNPFRGKDKEIEIQCLESMDLRVTAMADLYRKATFDTRTMRSMLPENLRTFTLRIQVAEIRTFHKLVESTKAISIVPEINLGNSNLGGFIGSLAQAGQKEDYQKKFELMDELISIMEFQLEHCEFDFNDSYPTEEVNMNGDMNPAKQKFKIKTRVIKEVNTYRIMDLILTDGPLETGVRIGKGKLNGSNTSSDLDEFAKRIPDLDNAFNPKGNNMLNNALGGLKAAGGALKSNLQDKLNELGNLPGALISRGLNQLGSKITGAALGNVYDLKNKSVESILGDFLGKTESQNIRPLGKEDVYPNNPSTDKTAYKGDSLGNIYK